jgi:hypothetical protein
MLLTLSLEHPAFESNLGCHTTWKRDAFFNYTDENRLNMI